MGWWCLCRLAVVKGKVNLFPSSTSRHLQRRIGILRPDRSSLAPYLWRPIGSAVGRAVEEVRKGHGSEIQRDMARVCNN